MHPASTPIAYGRRSALPIAHRPTPNVYTLLLYSTSILVLLYANRASFFIRRLLSRLEHLIHMPRAASAAENVLANPSTCSSSSIV